MASTIEISVKGKWTRVPALAIDDNAIIVKGSWMKTAIVNAEEWLPEEIEDPRLCIEQLKDRRSHQLRADIFNLLNTPSYGTPTATINSNGGQITSPQTFQNFTPDARFFQLSLKYVF